MNNDEKRELRRKRLLEKGECSFLSMSTMF